MRKECFPITFSITTQLLIVFSFLTTHPRILRSKYWPNSPKVEIDRFHKQTDSLVASAAMFNDNIWKRSRKKADWVIICSMDEHLYHPDLLGYLKQCQEAGITAILPAEGYQMVSDSFPDSDERLCESDHPRYAF